MTGSAIGSPAIGLIFDLTGSYKAALIILAALTLLSIAAIYICTNMSQKRANDLRVNNIERVGRSA